MAWNVVIAGGGFGGAAAARELERVLPKQSARLLMANETQLRPLHAVPAGGRGRDAGAAARGDAAAGHPQADLPAARLDRRPRPGGEDRRAAGQIRPDRDAALRPAAAQPRLGLAGAADPRPLRARGRLQVARRRDLPAQPRGRDAGGSQRDRRPGPPRRTAHLRLRRRRLRRPRGAGRAAGLRRRRDGPLPARPPARDALGPGRGRRPGPAGDRPAARRVRAAGAARARHRHPPRARPWTRSAPTSPASRAARRCRPGPSSGPPASPRSRSCAS